MHINKSNLSKVATKTLDNVDKYLEEYRKSKRGKLPEKVAIRGRDYKPLFASATKHLEKKTSRVR